MTRTTVTLLLVALTGCAVDAGAPKEALDEPAFSDGDDSADRFTRRLDVQGTIGFGAAVEGSYSTRGYAGYVFTGKRGARIELTLAGHDNDPVLYLYGPQRGRSWDAARPIASNDDSGGTLDSRITGRLPADGTYLALAREYAGQAGSFTLALGCSGDECRVECGGDDSCPAGSACNRVVCIRAPCPSYCEAVDPATYCERDTDCAAIPTSCCPCSMGGGTRAVNASYADALAPDCTTIRPFCPAVYLCRDEQPACVRNRCELVEAGAGTECPAGACGPALGMPIRLCDDGVSYAGPSGRCLRNDDGSCGWEILSCPPPPPPGPCFVGGCSGQLCTDREGGISTCEFRPEYACYRGATCERQPSGACGWTPTPELTACLASPPTL